MKCVAIYVGGNIVDVRRLPDTDAAKFVARGTGYHYCPKRVWKRHTRKTVGGLSAKADAKE